MDNKELMAKLAQMESQLDYLSSELAYLDRILIDCGFQDGIATLKATVEEMLA